MPEKHASKYSFSSFSKSLSQMSFSEMRGREMGLNLNSKELNTNCPMRGGESNMSCYK